MAGACGAEDVAYGTGGSTFLFQEVLVGYIGMVTRFRFSCRLGFGEFDEFVHGRWKGGVGD